jgi:hypothetical protein
MTFYRNCCLILSLVALMAALPLTAQQWERASNGLDAGSVRTFGFNATGDVYAGGEDGIYRLVDNDHWEMLHRGVRAYWFQTSSDGTMMMLASSPTPTSRYALYRSSDDGASWILSRDSVWTGQVRIAPDGTLYNVEPDKLLRSNDGGGHWTLLSAPEIENRGNALTIAVDGTVIFTPGDSTLYVSTDRGSSWSRSGPLPAVQSAVGLATLPDGRAKALIDYSRVYVSGDKGRSWEQADSLAGAGTVLPGGEQIRYYRDPRPLLGTSGLYRSSDNGTTWQQIDDRIVQALAIEPDGTIWRSLMPYCQRSDDGGRTWEDVTSGLRDIRPTTPVMDAAGNLYLARLERIFDDTDRINIASAYAIFHSPDNGASWRKVADSMSSDIRIDDDGRLYGKRILRRDSLNFEWMTPVVSTDGGGSWQRLYPEQLRSYHVHRNGVVTGVAATGAASGRLVISSNGGAIWEIASTPIGVRNYHRTEEGIIIAHLFEYGKIDSRNGIYRSTSNGKEWEPAITEMGEREFFLSSDNSGTIYLVGNTDGPASDDHRWIYRSIDNGKTFQGVRDSVASPFRFSATTHGTSFLFTYHTSGSHPALKSSDRGSTWSELPPAPGSMLAIITSGSDGSIYSSSQSFDQDSIRLYRSRDDGETWHPFSEGLPRGDINGLLHMPGSPLYIAVRQGIFRRESRSHVRPVAASTGVTFDVTPNPVHDGRSVTITFPTERHIRVSLHDILGRTITVPVDERHEGGVVMATFETGALAAGSYIIRVSTGAETISRVLLVR